MEWLNLHTSVLDSPEFLGADPVERGTWLCLLRYCAGQENGGIIRDCATWKDRQWQQVVSITLREVKPRTTPRLWLWQDDGHLVVYFYPIDAETKLNHKRDIARVNGHKGGRPPKKNPLETQLGLSTETNVGFETEPIEKPKGKGKEREKEDTPLPPLQGGESGRVEDSDLIRRINALRPQWDTGGQLDADNFRKFRKNREIFATWTEDDWSVMREFLRASLPEGSAATQPQQLHLFLVTPAATLGHARHWKTKQRPKLTVVPTAPTENPSDPPLSAEDMKTLLKTV